MGRVIGPYGIKGWVRVQPYSDDRAALTGYREWWIGGAATAVLEAKVHSTVVIARLAGLETPEQALKLKGQEIAVPREAFAAPAEGEFYYADLIGLDVVNAEGVMLGKVASLSSNGAHDLLALDGKHGQILPWIPQVVKKVDLAARRIEVDWQPDW
jgi:16S rRNA processing protein RimM